MKYKELLKQVTESVKKERELEEFKTYLMEAAKDGRDVTSISKLEQQYPTIYKSGKLWSWLRENDIGFSGSADSNGKNAGYSFWWQ